MSLKNWRQFGRTVRAALAANLCFAVLLVPGGSCAGKTEWILEQHHYSNGNAKVYIADDAVKIDNITRGFQLVAKAPKWKVEIFRPESKSIYITDLDKFVRFTVYGAAGIDGDPTKRPPRTPVETVQKDGVTMSKYEFGYGNAWLAKNISSRPEIVRVLSIYNQSPIPGIALNYSFLFSKQTSSRNTSGFFTLPPGRQTFLATSKIVKAPYNASDFVYPDGYHQVNAYSELLTKKVTQDELDAFIAH